MVKKTIKLWRQNRTVFFEGKTGIFDQFMQCINKQIKWSDVADFEQRELLKLRVYTSLKQASTLLTMIATVNM